MLRISSVLSRAAPLLLAPHRIPSPGSAKANPHSRKYRERAALRKGAVQRRSANEQASMANIGGTATGGGSDAPTSLSSSSSSPLSLRKGKAAYSLKVGKDLADRARYMSDGEWEAVPLHEKHAFTRYLSKQLKEHPTLVSEQQRRRYFETTLADPLALANPSSTVHDNYERIKLGLPVELRDPEQQLGVSQAVYDATQASMFEPENIHQLENAMIHLKQIFQDYVAKKREGLSTVAERTKLAQLSEELNHQTQRHLASMFKYAEVKLREAAKEERKRQLLHMQQVADLIHRRVKKDGATAKQTVASLKKQRVRELMRNAYGLDAKVAGTILKTMRAQETFLEYCEVFSRMVFGGGFHHSAKDESLDQYVDSIKKLYSADPTKLASLEAVQYMSALEQTSPVDWAKRWYESAILVPLKETEEYQALVRIEEEEKQRIAAAVKKTGDVVGTGTAAGEGATTTKQGDGTSHSTTSTEDHQSNKTNDEQEAEPRSDDNALVEVAEMATKVSQEKQKQVIRLAEKMFLNPEDVRLASVHEKRLRYLAYNHLETQIQRVRAKAALFEGVELLPEAEECRALYKQLQERKASLLSSKQSPPQQQQSESQPPIEEEDRSLAAAAAAAAATKAVVVTHNEEEGDSSFRLFDDPEARALYEKIRTIVYQTIQSVRVQNAADEKAAQLQRLLHVVKGTAAEGGGATPVEEALKLHDEKKKEVMDRILRIVEKDVHEDVQWVESLEEAERPPLLPVPEPMSYVSAQDIMAWKETREEQQREAHNPFKKKKNGAAGGDMTFQASFLGQPWQVPDKPLLFWGTGFSALQQGLQHAAEDAERRRNGVPLAPPYPCPENPWGWRLAPDVLDE